MVGIAWNGCIQPDPFNSWTGSPHNFKSLGGKSNYCASMPFRTCWTGPRTDCFSPTSWDIYWEPTFMMMSSTLQNGERNFLCGRRWAGNARIPCCWNTPWAFCIIVDILKTDFLGVNFEISHRFTTLDSDRGWSIFWWGTGYNFWQHIL